MKSPCMFPKEDIDNFRKSERGNLCMKLVRKDEEYTQESINDHLKRTVQVEIKDQKALLDISEEKDITLLLSKIKINLQECIKQRSINVSEKTHLVTLAYLFDAIELLREYPDGQGLKLEEYFYKTETMEKSELIDGVMEEFKLAELPMPVFMVGE